VEEIEMTPRSSETVSDLAPGRELDRQVAEQVMIVPRLYLYQTPAEFGEIALPGAGEAPPALRDHDLSEQTPQYSTDINQAWKIVEELNSRGWEFQVRVDRLGKVTAATGPNGEYRVGEDSVTQLTPAEAICKAALRALTEGQAKS
jgi:hypothetical protein